MGQLATVTDRRPRHRSLPLALRGPVEPTCPRARRPGRRPLVRRPTKRSSRPTTYWCVVANLCDGAINLTGRRQTLKKPLEFRNNRGNLRRVSTAMKTFIKQVLREEHLNGPPSALRPQVLPGVCGLVFWLIRSQPIKVLPRESRGAFVRPHDSVPYRSRNGNSG